MDPRQTLEQSGLFHTPSNAQVEAIRLEAARARDAAIAGMLHRGVRHVGQALAAIGAALASWPARRDTYESLRRLTDRELADIGLTRGDIARVFEPGFRLPARAANGNRAAVPGRAQAA